MFARRSLPLLVVLVTAAAACTPFGNAPGPSGASTDAGTVNAAMADVTAARQTLEQRVAATIIAVGKVPAMAQALRSPSAIDDALDDVPSIAASISAADPAALAALADSLDTAIITAIGAIDGALAGFDPTSWESRYLTAQRDVLAALAAWAGATRSLATTLDAHWPSVTLVVDRAAILDENRWRYRTSVEAAGTWEVESGDEIHQVGAVTVDLEPVVAARDIAAQSVADADRQAAVVFEDRPTTP